MCRAGWISELVELEGFSTGALTQKWTPDSQIWEPRENPTLLGYGFVTSLERANTYFQEYFPQRKNPLHG